MASSSLSKRYKADSAFYIVPLNQIKVTAALREKVDMGAVHMIAESLEAGVDLLQPIFVKERTIKNGVKGRKFRLLGGVQRYCAFELLDRDCIPCRVLSGNKIEIEQAVISENLCHKRDSCLEQSILLVKFCDNLANQKAISGQNVQKKRGRPPGGLAAMAQLLKYMGGTGHARRKMIERAYLISSIPPEVQKAIKAAGLEDNQSDLLRIGKIKNSVRAQLSLVDRLAAEASKRALPADRRGKSNDKLTDDEAAAPSPEEAGGADDTEDTSVNDDAADANDSSDTRIVEGIKETTLLDLEDHFCTQQLKKLWAYTPTDTREAFIEQARQRKCKLPAANVVQFITDVFQGRKKVPAAALKKLAKKKRIRWPVALAHLKAGGYKRYKKGRESGAIWYYLNVNRDGDGVPKVSEDEVDAAFAADRGERVVFDYSTEEERRRSQEYYDDI